MTTPDNPPAVSEAAAIAAGLSPKQREWIKAMPTIPTSLSPEQWDEMPRLYVQLEPDEVDEETGYLIWPADKHFFGAGHAHKPVGTEWYLAAWLNDLGLTLRAHLLGEDA